MKYLIKAMLTGAVITGSSLPYSASLSDLPSKDPDTLKSFGSKPPNILLIMTDQHNAGFIGCFGRKNLKTPNLDALAGQAAVFRSAYCASPISGPSRAAIFTGQYPLENGVYTNWIPLKDNSILLTERLSGAGYYNAMIGKLHLTPVDSSHGFTFRRMCDSPYDVYDRKEVIDNDYLTWAAASLGVPKEKLIEMAGESERLGVNNPGFWSGRSWTDNKHQMTTWTGNEAVSFIEGYKDDKPFFMHISFFGPHHPYSTCEPWDSMYDPKEVQLPPTWGKVQPGAQKGFRADWPESTWREIIAKYSGNISAIDYQIGRIITALKEKGLWDNTLIVFTSDHGDHMGDFSQLGKGTMLESSVRVPFIIKPPHSGKSGKDYPQVISLIDLYSTFLDYAGVAGNSSPDSKSIRPLLDGNSEWKNQVFSSLCSADGLNGQVMFIRDKYKCVGFLKDGKMTVELYDRMAQVPDLVNLAENHKYDKITGEMKANLEKWLNTEREK